MFKFTCFLKPLEKQNLKIKGLMYIFLISELTPLIITFTPRGAQVIYLGGYKFHKQIMFEDRIRWLCSTNQKKRCKAFIITDPSHTKILKSNHDHNHAPLPTSDGVVEANKGHGSYVNYLRE